MNGLIGLLGIIVSIGVVGAITTAKPKIARASLTGSSPGAARVMSKKYSWELDEAKMLAKSTFKIKPAALIARCKEVIDRDILEPEDLSEEFVFQFPVVGPLTKAEYLKAVGGFQIKTMFPDLNLGVHNFHVDPLQPNRVWYTVAFTATNSGDGPFGPATNIQVECPPQVNSLTFDEDGKVVKYTGGYVVDKTVGNSGGMGGLFGPLYAIGKGFPFPEAKPYTRSWQFRAFSFVGNLASKFRKQD